MIPHTKEAPCQCTHKLENMCDALVVVLVLSTETVQEAKLYSAGSGCPSAVVIFVNFKQINCAAIYTHLNTKCQICTPDSHNILLAAREYNYI